MIANMKIKTVGGAEFKDGNINLPESCKEYLEKYDLELVVFPRERMLSVHFVKDEVDIYSHSIYNHEDAYNLREGFRYAFERLKELDKPKRVKVKIPNKRVVNKNKRIKPKPKTKRKTIK